MNKKTINKENEIITTYGILNRGNKPEMILDFRERKMLNYIIAMIQDKYLDKNVSNKRERLEEREILKDRFKMITNTQRTFDGFESIQFDFSYSKVKDFMKMNNKSNDDIEEVLLSLRRKDYIFTYEKEKKDGTTKVIGRSIKSFIKVNVDEVKVKGREWFGSLSIDSDFIYVNLMYKTFTSLSLFDTRVLSSKYSIIFHEELSRIYGKSRKKNDTHLTKSLSRMNSFLDSDCSKGDMDRIILRTKKELLRNKFFTFDYSIYKNPNKEVIFNLENIQPFHEKDSVYDYINNYLEFRLLSSNEQKEFIDLFPEDYEEIYEQRNSNDESRTKFLQSKK